jgi:hypothetical protein
MTWEQAMMCRDASPETCDQQASAANPAPVPRRPARLRAKLLLLLVSLLVALLLGEIAVRLGILIAHRAPLVRSDAQAGWSLEPNLRNLTRVEKHGKYVISTDAEGHRLTRPLDDSTARDQPAVLLVGDSFAQGQAVNDAETFAWVLAHEASLNVINLGVLGYGTDQELITLEAYLEAHRTLKVRDIVLFVFDNDFLDVQISYHPALGRSKPRFHVRDGRLERGNYELGLSDHLMDLSAFYWLVNSKRAMLVPDPYPPADQGLEEVVACVRAMRELAGTRAARFHVFAHRHLLVPVDISPSTWAEFLHRCNAIDLTHRLLAMKDPNPISYDNNHWSPAAHRLVAGVLKEHLDATAAVAH